MAIDAIYLDVDGLAADWLAGLCRLMKLDHAEVLEQWPRGTYDAFEVLKLNERAVWAKIKAIGPAWWEELPLLEGALQLWGACSRLAPTFWLTAPPPKTGAGESAHGKTNFLMRHFGPGTFLIGHSKIAVARPGIVLIDDHDKNVDAFTAREGHAVTWPNPWNRRHAITSTHAKLTAITCELDQIAKRPRW